MISPLVFYLRSVRAAAPYIDIRDLLLTAIHTSTRDLIRSFRHV